MSRQVKSGFVHLDDLEKYVNILVSFVERTTDAANFQRAYFDRYLSDPTNWTEEEYEILNKLFYEVEDYQSDPKLRKQVAGSIDEDDLRKAAHAALTRLTNSKE